MDSLTFFPFYLIHLFIFNLFLNFQNGESCFAVQMHVAKGRMGSTSGHSVWGFTLVGRDSGLGDSVIRFPCVWNQGHERWGKWGWAWGTCLCFRIRCGRQCCKPVPAESLHQWPHLDLVPAPLRVYVCLCDLYFSQLSGTTIIPSSIYLFLFQLYFHF